VSCEDTPFDLLSKMLVYNPDNRISATEALRHPYFDERPICVMNIARQIPLDEWNDLVTIGVMAKEKREAGDQRLLWRCRKTSDDGLECSAPDRARRPGVRFLPSAVEPRGN
jgi:serine/threonine protein kinase